MWSKSISTDQITWEGCWSATLGWGRGVQRYTVGPSVGKEEGNCRMRWKTAPLKGLLASTISSSSELRIFTCHTKRLPSSGSPTTLTRGHALTSCRSLRSRRTAKICAAMVVIQVLAKHPSVKKILGRKFLVNLPNPPKVEPSESRSPCNNQLQLQNRLQKPPRYQSMWIWYEGKFFLTIKSGTPHQNPLPKTLTYHGANSQSLITCCTWEIHYRRSFSTTDNGICRISPTPWTIYIWNPVHKPEKSWSKWLELSNRLH